MNDATTRREAAAPAGTLVAVGVGPGDPGLVTVAGAAAIARADVLAYPADGRGNARARAIAAPHVAGAPEELGFHLPMAPDPAVAQAAYDEAARRIGDALAAGRTVALVCEGDPLLFGSATMVLARLAERFPVSVVPGIVSATAAAARLVQPLAVRGEVFAVVPGTLDDAGLDRALDAADAVAILKVGRHFDRIRDALRRAGRAGSARLVTEATGPGETVAPLEDVPAGPKPYFSLVLAGSRHTAARELSRATADGTGQAPATARSPGTDGPSGPATGEAPRSDGARAAGEDSPADARAAAIVVLGPSGLKIAGIVATALAGTGLAAEIHVRRSLEGEAGRGVGPAAPVVPFAEATAQIGALFAAGRTVVGVCAAGILIRAVAAHLADKRAEPPLLAVADDGSAVVPLLGAHRGAAALARTLADALGGTAAITTAGDVRLGVALDEPPAGWTLANPADAKGATAALLAGEPVAVDPALAFLADRLPTRADAPRRLAASVAAGDQGGPERLVYRPRRLALGVGCERGCPPEALIAHAETVLAEADLAREAVACVVSLDLKADEPAVHALAERLGVPARFLSREALAAEAHRLATPSAAVAAEVGVPGVAEAAALAAAGPEGTLLVPKLKAERATAAVAAAPGPIDPVAVGRSRGRLAVIGTGPGAAAWRTAEQVACLSAADEWVGYGPYLDLVGDLRAGRPVHAFPLGAEEERVRFALERAGEGLSVALVSSGDPGVYAMAALVFELLDPAGDAPVSAAARRAEVLVAPGISAAQAAAARLGAPFGHDFCYVSLSDLLTPWEAIEARLRAAAAADFAIALYNPRSARRRRQLPQALAILRAARPADTPVAIATDVGRPGETIETTTLAAIDAERVGMLSVVLVGASSSRAFATGAGETRVYTPRGYAAKRTPAADHERSEVPS